MAHHIQFVHGHNALELSSNGYQNKDIGAKLVYDMHEKLILVCEKSLFVFKGLSEFLLNGCNSFLPINSQH